MNAINLIYYSLLLLINTLLRVYKREEYRTRRDKTARSNNAWNIIMSEMTDAYLSYDFEGPPQQEEEAEVVRFPPVKIVTLYSKYIQYKVDYLTCLLRRLSPH